MEVSKTKNEQLFQLTTQDKSLIIKGDVFSNGRKLIGRSESCDIVISHPGVSAVHAVLEVSPRGIKIFDMNSRNGTMINGKRVVTSILKENDSLSLGAVNLSITKYTAAAHLPPVLESLEPESGKASTTLPPVAPEVSSEETPYIVYPLGSDPKADYSEYIFEDVDELYPIFKYEHGKQAVEIIILFNDKVYSVDYLPDSNGLYSIVGAKPKNDDVEFAYLGKDEKVPFVEINNGNCVVHKLHNYTTQHLTNDEILDIKEGRVNIQNEDIVRLENGHLEIYIRKVFSPPIVKPAPIFGRDRALFKYICFVLLFVLVVGTGISLIEIEEKEDEKDPDRIARILYKTPVRKIRKVKEVLKKKPKPQKDVKKVVKKKTKPKPSPKKTAQKPKKVVKQSGSKTAKKVLVQKKVKKPAPKTKARANKVAGAKAAKSKTRSSQTRKAVRPSPKIGRVDTYKSFDFKSTISSSMAKGGSLRGAKVAKASSNNSFGSTNIGGGVASNLKKANVGTQVGNLTGSTIGKLSQSKGTEGLSSKTGIYTAGIPSETVVLGSMDPEAIRRILREHIPQFRYCYQKELDRNAKKDITGTIKLVFTIGASGSVSRAGVGSGSGLPRNVKGCVVGVLRGIRFPRPLGGGTVDVNQPFNFMPKRI